MRSLSSNAQKMTRNACLKSGISLGIRPEYLLLALADAEPDSHAQKVLLFLGITGKEIIEEAGAAGVPSESFGVIIPAVNSPEGELGRLVLEAAGEEADRRGSAAITTADLLIGLATLSQGPVSTIFFELGIEGPDCIRRALRGLGIQDKDEEPCDTPFQLPAM